MARRDIWLYDPDICDGDYCPMNCDICSKKDIILDKQEAEQEDEEAVCRN